MMKSVCENDCYNELTTQLGQNNRKRTNIWKSAKKYSWEHEIVLNIFKVNILIYRLVNKTRAIVLVQAAIDRAGSKTNFTKNCTGRSFFFFLNIQRRLVLIFFLPVIRKGKAFHSWKQDMYLFIKDIIGKI